MNFTPGVLQGQAVRLEPLGMEHAQDLLAAASHDEIWLYLDEPTPRNKEQITALIADAQRELEAGTRIPFAVVEMATGAAIGSISFIDIRPRDRGVEVGWTWFTPGRWGQGLTTEATYLLLRHAFEDQNMVRVAMKADLRNLRSQRVMEALGATREGVFRKHRILSNGHQRDSVYYSIIDTEWPTVRDRLSPRFRLG